MEVVGLGALTWDAPDRLKLRVDGHRVIPKSPLDDGQIRPSGSRKGKSCSTMIAAGAVLVAELLTCDATAAPRRARARRRVANPDEGERVCLRVLAVLDTEGSRHGASTGSRGAREPVRRSRCAGSRWCRPRSSSPGSRATIAARRRRRGLSSAPRHSGCDGPTTAIAVSCSRLLISLHHSLLMLPTGPGSSRPSRCARSSASCGAGTSALPRTPRPVAARGADRRARRARRARRQLVDELGVDHELARVHAAFSCVSVELAMRQPSCSARRVGRRHEHVGEEHLVELRLVGDLAQRPHLDARRVHVDDERGDALALRRVGIGAREAPAPVGELRVARPHLLAVEEPAAVDRGRARRERREVAARAGLAEQLAPDLRRIEDVREPAGLLRRCRARAASGRRGSRRCGRRAPARGRARAPR